jgi:hypothetical protein
LPGAAALAAVAALAVFVTARPEAAKRSVEDMVAKSTTRSRPFEVEGVATGPWVQQHYDPSVALPTFGTARIDRWGARLFDVYDREAVQLYYRITTPEDFSRDVQVTIFDAHDIGFVAAASDQRPRPAGLGSRRPQRGELPRRPRLRHCSPRVRWVPRSSPSWSGPGRRSRFATTSGVSLNRTLAGPDPAQTRLNARPAP